MSYLQELRAENADALKDYYAEQHELNEAYLKAQEQEEEEEQPFESEPFDHEVFNATREQREAHVAEIQRLNYEVARIEANWDRVDARGGDTFALSEELQEAQQRLFDTKERLIKVLALSNSGCAGVGSA